VCKKEDLYVQIKFLCRVHRGWTQECYDCPTANDYKQGSIFMTFEAPDLLLRLPRRHFFYACLYSPPHLGFLSRIVPRVFALIHSPCRLCMSFCAHSLPLSHALFPEFLCSFAPSIVSCSFCGGPLERCCGVCFCLQTGRGRVFGVWIIPSCTSWRFLHCKGWVP
jgi:hypothetical protein